MKHPISRYAGHLDPTEVNSASADFLKLSLPNLGEPLQSDEIEALDHANLSPAERGMRFAKNGG